jgi:hypothetical protein
MFEKHGTHVCRHCGKKFFYTAFVRKEYTEDLRITAKCLFCGEEQKWTERIKGE